MLALTPQPYISMIKVAAPSMSLKIIDEAMQMYEAPHHLIPHWQAGTA